MDKNIQVMGLDDNFEIVSILTFTNLQWRRKYYESGTFSIQIPAEQYDSRIKYIFTKDRPEVGEISQINFIQEQKGYVFALSGFFLEEELNRRIVYKKGDSNITNAPTWLNQSGAAEDVATAFFNAFKDIHYTFNGESYESDLGIGARSSQGRGHQSEHERGEEFLGDKIHTILKPSEMSYRIVYDFLTNEKVFECYKGHDRTQDNTDGENPAIFSTAYGNLKDPNIVISDSDYKNCYISTSSYSEDNVDYVNVQVGCERASDDTSDRFIQVGANVSRSEYASTEEYIRALHTMGHEELIEKKKTASFDFSAVEGSYDYMVDFDLGDKCSIEIPEIGVSKDAVLIECTEVIKKGEWSLSLQFDTDN